MAMMDTAKLQEQAIKHLWLHFTQMAGYDPDKHPVMVRGEGINLFDSNGNKYMDFLSGLFTVQIGYSHGEEIGRAMLEQAMELPYYTNWTYSHPRALELSQLVAQVHEIGREGPHAHGRAERPQTGEGLAHPLLLAIPNRTRARPRGTTARALLPAPGGCYLVSFLSVRNRS